jgi:hypothetical protein
VGRYLDLADSIGRRGNGCDEINERYEISPLGACRAPAADCQGAAARQLPGMSRPSAADLAVRALDLHERPGYAVTPIARLTKPRAPVNLDEALAAACVGVAGITLAQFRALLCSEDIADIEAGGIHPKTLHAYVESFAEELRSGRIAALPERKGGQAGTGHSARRCRSQHGR